ncbi:MAG: beta-L-arabinofuranosidase domain-containing protein [Lachnospiraceae bacterium]
MKEIAGRNVVMRDAEVLRREEANRDYLMRLSPDSLLRSFRVEAGLPETPDGAAPSEIYGGWEFPTCQLRGHFTGHYLSALAMRYYETGDEEAKARGDRMVDALRECQRENGGEWAAAIPEKYFRWIGIGKTVWAPHYTVHKLLMGLIDMYRYAGNREALETADRMGDWFARYAASYDREQFDNILDFETGGMLEIWALMLEITGQEKYRTLLYKYYRGRMFDRLLAGGDPLTNMHANTTIPEVIGCCEAYEATGDEKWKRVAEAYWKCAVTDRGTYATGGQTLGEVWTPEHLMSARLGDRNQEHCTVYNMIRLAAHLFLWTGDPGYADYIERNLYNGIMAQGYWQDGMSHGLTDGLPEHPKRGLLTYFLPLRAGARKGWSSETQDFFCCHGTLVQANASWNRHVYYLDGSDVYVCQYFDSEADFASDGLPVRITQREDTLTGSFHLSSTSPERQSISAVTSEVKTNPDCRMIYLKISCGSPVRFALHLRVPSWCDGNAEITVNGEKAEAFGRPGTFAVLDRVWKDQDTVGILFRKTVRAVSLPGDSRLAAFTYGPLVLAGEVPEERVFHLKSGQEPEDLIAHETEREWGRWKDTFRTVGVDPGFRLIPLKDVGYEPYTVYFELDREDG